MLKTVYFEFIKETKTLKLLKLNKYANFINVPNSEQECRKIYVIQMFIKCLQTYLEPKMYFNKRKLFLRGYIRLQLLRQIYF